MDAHTGITSLKLQAKNIAEEAKKLRAMLKKNTAFAEEVEAEAIEAEKADNETPRPVKTKAEVAAEEQAAAAAAAATKLPMESPSSSLDGGPSIESSLSRIEGE